MSANRFEGRVAIVTGGAAGIGLATACRLGAEGACVLIADRDADHAAGAADQVIAAGAPAALGKACDVGCEADAQAAVAQALAQWGRLDVIVNNAGQMLFKPLAEHTEADMLQVLRVDLLGAFFFVREAFRRELHGASIVNVSSIHAEKTTPLVTAYAAAKAALLSLTRSASIEGKPLGIRVNAVLPGAIDTPMLRGNPNIRSGLEPLDERFVGRPEQVAAAIAWLASDDSSFVQGALLRVDGGRLDRL